MMGERLVMQESLFYAFRLEDHVPCDHLLRRIDRFVDCSELRQHLAGFYSSMGRPSVDPELMIRMLLIGYCLGIRSERRLCEEVHLNLAYRWFCRLGLEGKVPDHSTFSKNRHGRFRESDLFRHLFEAVVQRCLDEGLVGGEGFAVDASLIHADANKQRCLPGAEWVTQDHAEAAPRAVREYLATLDEAAWGTATDVEPKFVSPSDPAAQWTGAMRGPAFFAYADNYLIDLKAAVIVDVEASRAVRQAEVGAARTMLERTAERFGLKPERLAGDSAYGSAEMLHWLVDEQEIEPHVPVIDKSERQDGTFSRSDFSLYLETRWASLVPYAAAADLLADVLPVGSGVNATTLRQHVLRAAERTEADLAEQRTSFSEGRDPRNWEDLPDPEGRMVLGLDGGYIRDWRDRRKNFELIVGRSMPDEGEACYIGFVHGYDRKPQRRIIDHLRRQGIQADQDLTIITDGGDEVRALAERICPCREHVLDWFHITMRITVLRQFAQGLVHHDKDAGTAALDELRRIKWFLWHGNTYQAREAIDDLVLDLEALDSRYPNLRKFRTTMREFQVYIASNEGSLINYGERYRSGERISSAFVEATVNAVISKRFAKKQQMQWSRREAHLLLQTRTRALDGSLRATFEHWYPGLINDNVSRDSQAAA